MPTHACQKDGKPGYQWGGHGKCYTYTKGNESSKKAAKKKADAQGRAAYSAGYKGESVTEKISNKLKEVLENEDRS
jgi:hypothetical protein